MTNPQILAATLVAAFLYVVSPGPAFLALFTLAASRGRAAGAKFICGHLVGDVTWGALAVAAIVGANRSSRRSSRPRLWLRLLSDLSRSARGGRRGRTHRRARSAPSRPLADRSRLRPYQSEGLSGGAGDVFRDRRPSSVDRLQASTMRRG